MLVKILVKNSKYVFILCIYKRVLFCFVQTFLYRSFEELKKKYTYLFKSE